MAVSASGTKKGSFGVLGRSSASVGSRHDEGGSVRARERERDRERERAAIAASTGSVQEARALFLSSGLARLRAEGCEGCKRGRLRSERSSGLPGFCSKGPGLLEGSHIQ